MKRARRLKGEMNGRGERVLLNYIRKRSCRPRAYVYRGVVFAS